eukprot:scaffold53052_cov53-Cyclotella_meneghiniana.AAC.2
MVGDRGGCSAAGAEVLEGGMSEASTPSHPKQIAASGIHPNGIGERMTVIRRSSAMYWQSCRAMKMGKNVMGRNVESNDTNLANLEACMKCIVKHHLSGTDDDKQADTVTGLLFRSGLIQRYKDALKVDQQAIANNQVMCPSKQPPCILHFHQRTIEKITAEIIARGLECCRSGRERESFVTKDDNTGWRVPLKDDKKTLADITMDDSTAKMFEKNINYLIDVCLQSHPLGEEYVSDWKECMVG